MNNQNRHKFRAWDGYNMMTMPLDGFFGISRFFGMLNDDHIIMQCIAVHDGQDTLIYEGDIVEGYGGIAVIEYNDHYEAGACYHPVFHNDGDGDCWEIWSEKLRWYRFKIIGNIYENTGLLKEQS